MPPEGRFGKALVPETAVFPGHDATGRAIRQE
jgi:hypothetical protein